MPEIVEDVHKCIAGGHGNPPLRLYLYGFVVGEGLCALPINKSVGWGLAPAAKYCEPMSHKNL